MLQAKGYAAHNAETALVPFEFERKAHGNGDLLIDILYCGICQADIHQAKTNMGERYIRWFQSTKL